MGFALLQFRHYVSDECHAIHLYFILFPDIKTRPIFDL